MFLQRSQMGGSLIRTVGGQRSNFEMMMMALCNNIKRPTYLKTDGVGAF
jgi:hypothetical protein